MPSYSEFGWFPPLDDRPVADVPASTQNEPKTEPEPDICSRCGQEDCKHKRR